MKKIFRHWIAGEQLSLHLVAGGFFSGIYALGSLIASTSEKSVLPGILHRLGFGGLFLVLLLVLLHMNLHGSSRFLADFKETSHLPVKQLSEVSIFCMLLFLPFGAAVMAGFAAFLPWIWNEAAKWAARLRVDPDLGAAAEILPDAGSLSDEMPTALPEAVLMPAWARVLEIALSLLGYVMAGVLLLAVLYRFALWLCSRLPNPGKWDDDVRISLKPDLSLSDAFLGTARGGGSQRARRTLPWLVEPGERIRRTYRRRLSAGFGRQKKIKDFAWAAPAELEKLASVDDARLHELYEKARYSILPCTGEEAESIQG